MSSRRVARPLAVVCAAGLLGGGPLVGQGLDAAREALRTGEYADAVRGFRRAVDTEPASPEARVGLVEALATTGQYEEALTAGRAAPGPGLANAVGEVLVLLGRWDEAETEFRRAIDQGGRWALTAEANLAELDFSRGRIDAATARFDRFIDVYNQSRGRLSAPDLVAVGRAVRFLGRGNPDLFQDALRAFDEAARADPAWLESRVQTGNLFLEKYSSPEAQTEFDAVLAVNSNHPEALFGMARALEFDGQADSRKPIERLLQINPQHAEARAFLAGLHLTRDDPASALEQAERALRANPRSLSALSALAAAHFMAGDLEAFDGVRDRALSINPRYAELDTRLAEIAVRMRRYADAVERARAAVRLDSAAWSAWGLLGMNELRVGDIEAGRTNLERAFAGDPYNPWFKNNLDLLDTFERYETRETEHFQLFLHGSEAELLATYLAPIAEEAYDRLSRHYGIDPDLPVRAELFPSHADFSVRTLGEAGLGALGVSFGRVLVMDAPSARERGEYNWASVFWHELAHTFHLALTDHRVPRWFSEGLAVHEQRKARDGWGHQATIPFLQALRDRSLKPVSELNDGFMRPDYPQQVVFSYYQASLVFQVIEERHGFGAIRAMLEGYRAGRTTDELFESVLRTTPGDFDDDFDAWLRQRFAGPLAGLAELGEAPPAQAGVQALEDFVRSHPGDLVGRLRLGARLVAEGRPDDARPHLDAALRIFPDYGGPDSPYRYLARIHRERGDLERAAAALARLTALNESDYGALVEMADVLARLGRRAEAASALDRAVQIWPYDVELHQRLADLHASLGNHATRVRERRAVVALAPVDRAAALYQLALAERDAGDREAARRSVLRALEVAPSYPEALELLLALRRGTAPETH